MKKRLRCRLAPLRVESLEDRSVPSAAYDPFTVVVAVRTGDPTEPVAVRVAPVEPAETVELAVARWQRDPSVAYAEPNYLISAAVLPNDPGTGLLYGQNNTGQSGGTVDADMDASEAWDVTTGSPRTTVAVIDTGIDYTHPDLYLNVWINQAEIPTAVRALLTDVDADGLLTFWDLNAAVNVGAGRIADLNANGYIDGGDLLYSITLGGWADGLDGGGNGYTDDLIGWDFVGNDNDPMDAVAEGGGHGTHVAGTIGAVGDNGVGVTGVAWQVQLMPVRLLGTDGGTTAAAAAAIRYSAANGAVVSNNSWGGDGYSQAVYDAVAYARTRGQIFVTAAGNESADNDATARYPANLPLSNVVAVAATDRSDRLAPFSNYGRATVDLAAAGVTVVSTYPDGLYASMSGTSMAAPHVSGALALLLSDQPALSYSQAIGRLLSTVDPIAGLSAITLSGGRVNVFAALSAGAVGDSAAPSEPLTPTVTLQSSASATFAGAAVTLTARVSGTGGAPTGTIAFVNATTGATLGAAAVSGAGVASITTSAFPLGASTIVAVYSGDGNYAAASASVVEAVNRRPMSAVVLPGLPDYVFVLDGPTGALRGALAPFGAGGVRAATGDVNNDGFDDLIAAGALGRVRIYSGRDLAPLADYAALPGGMTVAAGDVNGDGFADVVVGTATGLSVVAVFSGRDRSLLAAFLPFGALSGGTTVASADVNRDGFADIFVAPAGFPLYAVFDGRDQSFLGLGLEGGVFVG